MNIHEYQAKKLFREYGLNILNGDVAFSSNDAIDIAKKIDSSKWVVKAQIHAGGRGKGGGIKIANSLEEVKELSESIIRNEFDYTTNWSKRKKVLKVYIEQACEIKKEFYLGIVLDRSKGKFVMMASTEGGMDIEKVAEENPEKIFKVTIDPSEGIKDYQIRQLAFKLLIPKEAFQKFFKTSLFVIQTSNEKDFTLVEINPLILTAQNEVIALDAKVNIDDNALFRHQDLKDLLDETEVDPKELEAEKYDLSYVKLDGKIGCMVNGAGLAMATMDIIKLKGSSPANFLDVGGGASKEKVKGAFQIIISDKDVEAILVNIFGGIMRCDIIAEGIVEAAKEIKLDKPLVVRLEGTNVEEGKKILQKSDLDIIAASDLEEAAEKIVKVVEGS